MDDGLWFSQTTFSILPLVVEIIFNVTKDEIKMEESQLGSSVDIFCFYWENADGLSIPHVEIKVKFVSFVQINAFTWLH